MKQSSAEQIAAGMLLVGFPGPTVGPDLEDLIRRGTRNLLLFRRNTGSAAEVRRLTDQLRRLAGDDALIAVDHEGGLVTRLDRAATLWPSAMACSATGDVDLVEDAWFVGASELASLGINLNLAPVVDVLTDHRNPVLGTRAFSDDPSVTAAFGSAVVRGHQRAGVGSTLKHFPGHGATPVDSHADLPVVDRPLDLLRNIDLPPFAEGIEAGADCVMVSHVWVPDVDPQPTPAIFSSELVRIARDELQFDGVIVTDCLEMGAIERRMTTGEAVVRAVCAGCDLVSISHRIDRQREGLAALTRAIEDGTVDRRWLERSMERIAALRHHVTQGTASASQDGEPLAGEIARRAVTLVRNDGGLVPLSVARESSVACVCFGGETGVAEEGTMLENVLTDALRRRHAHVDDIRVGPGEEAHRVASRAGQADVILVATSFATGRPWQAEIVKVLAALGKPLVVMATRDPFDLLCFPDVPCYLATYGEHPASIETALDIIVGEEQPRGHLPVTIPGLYARGHGIQIGSPNPTQSAVGNGETERSSSTVFGSSA